MQSLLASVLLAASRVAVVYGGPDPAAGGVTEAAIEAQLTTAPAVVVVPAAELVRQPVAVLPPDDAAAQAQITSLLAKADSAYFEGRLEDASKYLSAVPAKSLESSPDRPRYLFLRAAIALKQQRTAQAEADVKTVLFLAPDQQAAGFPPSMQEFVEQIRLSMPARIAVRFIVSPAQAEVVVDGRKVESGVVGLLPGIHRVVVRAPGYRTVSRGVLAEPDEPVRIRLPLALGEGADAAIAEWVWSPTPSQRGPDAVQALAKAGRLDRLVVVSTRKTAGGDESRAVVWSGRESAGSPVFAAGSGDGALAAWAGGAIASGVAAPVVIAAATPIPPVRNPAQPPKPVATPAPKSSSAGNGGRGGRKVLLWSAIGVGVLALGAGAAAASQSGGTKTETNTVTPKDETTFGGW